MGEGQEYHSKGELLKNPVPSARRWTRCASRNIQVARDKRASVTVSCVSARGGSRTGFNTVRSGNPDWLPDSAGRVAGSPRTWKVRP
eukprot:1598578-Prymnesium_polylepis.1